MNRIAPPPLLDPFEHELTLSEEPRVLSFSPRTFELALDDLVRNWAFDLVGAIPRPLGSVSEELPQRGRPLLEYQCTFFQVGPSTLALVTQIVEGPTTHRVLELLGVREDVRVRLNLTRFEDTRGLRLAPAAREAVEAGRALGQVRIWGSENPVRDEARVTLDRVMRNMGFESQILDRTVVEPVYVPPAGGRLTLDGLPSNDLKVADKLLGILNQLPVEKAQRRAPRRVGAHSDRIRRKGSIVSFRYETHRCATGVLHMRRREVEAGVERPGLVRTFNLAGMRGAARLRVRDVGGRASAEFAGTQESVTAIYHALLSELGGRAG